MRDLRTHSFFILPLRAKIGTPMSTTVMGVFWFSERKQGACRLI